VLQPILNLFVGWRREIKTSDLLNEISYLPQDNFIPNSFRYKRPFSWLLQREATGFYADEMIQC
jgi:hypothetical protein